jgi:subtilisin-like proprotein convertase family protein
MMMMMMMMMLLLSSVWIKRLHSSPSQAIEDGAQFESTYLSDGCVGSDSTVLHLEHVQVIVDMDTQSRGDYSIRLFSPSGTESVLVSRRQYDSSGAGYRSWKFVSVVNWGENPTGTWRLVVVDEAVNGRTGKLKRWRLGMLGTATEVIGTFVSVLGDTYRLIALLAPLQSLTLWTTCCGTTRTRSRLAMTRRSTRVAYLAR